ncbi:LexA family protein [Acidithiobacillus ferridurans]|uniref:Translesion error-prone DNA polymerase V autoproteolytic subunit n=1 Tax=Acidithiobacillus ferridurans TaxID=1232575 RepID=A0A8X8KD73_ACIFI|nr:translesion error-prone DNA polymerase V autoproteolytic subunit [Acidithiobacillus ferridurans]MBU2714576.1 translesion error-prone DNA polymerase V autoproteolytic subunit [Acidithiobacillus ferridurans]MBU2724802.1 translesion error-prone DNA polymerase V autoproteolytic subunit [Acidithiobacillus ferridurans]MBU2725844.1 translesion error-prone DNA polymerase V autoproteolytic subunit [Acidithiobacillus ferridurans]
MPEPHTIALDPRPIAADTIPYTIPVMLSKIAAGFPSPADDYIEGRLDLNEHLILHREATFILRISGWSMRDAGIFDGDEILVDRAIEPADGRIVVAALHGELTVKRLRRQNGVVSLVAENPDFSPIILQEGEECLIWGVVTRVLHKV